MLDQIEGSQAMASAIAACRPEVVCAYPITPQTHIVEALGAKVKAGTLQPCAFINVESEFAAMSVAIGAAAAGSRAYTATASQGLLFMSEAVHNASGLGLPIVMTVANRAIGAPINIWNDHSDAMALRDAGWVQLYASDNQEAVDLHIIAFRLAQELSLPVMVCVDGFALTHAVERIDVPEPDQVDAFLPPFVARERLDPDEPVTIGAMVGPEAFTEVRYLADARMREVPGRLEHLAKEFRAVFGRDRHALFQPYRLGGASTVIVSQGSVSGTLTGVIDRLRDQGSHIGSVAVTMYRPFPDADLLEHLAGVEQVIVVDRAFSPGTGGFLATDVTRALGRPVTTVVAGLGGRPVTARSLETMLRQALDGALPAFSFLDLDEEVVGRELQRAGVGSGRPRASEVVR